MCVISWVARDKKTDCFFSGVDLEDIWLVENLWEVEGRTKEDMQKLCEKYDYVDWLVYPVINLNM